MGGLLPTVGRLHPHLPSLPLSFCVVHSFSLFSFVHEVHLCTLPVMAPIQAPSQLVLLLLLSHFSRVRLCATRPWNSPGKNTGVGCHFLLQGIKVKSESEVAQSCLTLRDPMDCSPPGSSVHGIFQARVLKWGAIAFVPVSGPA